MPESNAIVVIDEMDLKQVVTDFSEQLDTLEEAISKTGEAQELAGRVSGKGFWRTLKGGISGSNDKDLAKCVKGLGGSLETTQKIVQLMLQVGQVKNVYLKNLHGVIVDKICSLETNVGDLDCNQQGSSAATLAIARKIKEQLEDRIAHEEKIQQHDESISKLKKFSEKKDVLDEQQSEALDKLQQLNQKKDVVDGEQTRLINDLQTITLKKDELDDQQSQELQQIRIDLTRLEETVKGQANIIKMLQQDKGGGILRVLSFAALGLSVAAIILTLVI